MKNRFILNDERVQLLVRLRMNFMTAHGEWEHVKHCRSLKAYSNHEKYLICVEI
jgi:hypothetical protein